MKASLPTRLLHLAWKAGLALLERLYVRPAPVFRALADSLVTVGPLVIVAAFSWLLLFLLDAGSPLFDSWQQAWGSTALLGKAGLVALVGLACIVAMVGLALLLRWLCFPFRRFHDPKQRPGLIRLLEQAYPDVALPICCSTQWEAWLIRFVFSEENQSRHRERALAVTLPAPVRTPPKARF